MFPLIHGIVSQVGAPFSPLDVAGLKAWYDFGDAATLFTDTTRTTPVASDGDLIAGVTDKSGTNYHLSQPTSGQRPAYKVAIQNSLSIARFDGSADNMILSPAETARNWTFFVVVKDPTPTSGTAKAFFDSNTGRLIISHLANSTPKLGYFDGTWRNIANVASGAQILTWILDSTNNSDVFRNGTNLGSAAYVQKALGGGTRIMSDSSGTSQFTGGDLCEMLIYSGALAQADTEDIGNYLATRWGITLTGSFTY